MRKTIFAGSLFYLSLRKKFNRKVMKIALYVLLFMSFFILDSCTSDDGISSEMKNQFVDISDFSMYVGNQGGGVEVKYNNLKKADLVRLYFGNKFKLDNIKTTIEFNGDKITFSDNGKKIVSNYIFRQDSLYVIKRGDSLSYVALGTNKNNLYQNKALAYCSTVLQDDTIAIYDDQRLDLDKTLQLAGYTSLKDMVNPKDTIVWCNVKYIFK